MNNEPLANLARTSVGQFLDCSRGHVSNAASRRLVVKPEVVLLRLIVVLEKLIGSLEKQSATGGRSVTSRSHRCKATGGHPAHATAESRHFAARENLQHVAAGDTLCLSHRIRI